MIRMRAVSLCSAAVLSAVFLSHCASSGQTLNATPPTTKLGSYKRVVVNVTSTVPDTSPETIQLESQVVSTLRGLNTFDNVSTANGGGSGDLRINATIADLRKVSGAKRAMLGGLAGRGNLVVNVKLVDTASGKEVGAFTAQGTTSGGTVFAGTTEQAIELAARQIAQYVQQNM